MDTINPIHPLGAKAKILLSSVFGPYAQDDEYGSRKINPMELYHNQVTRVQGPFSLRMFHRSFGLMLLSANIDAPCTLLDFPTLSRFTEEIQKHSYDIVGISSIIPNIGKVKKMCELVRKYLPKAAIVVGGHIASMPDIHKIIDADYVVKGDGISWFRKFLGQDDSAAVKPPLVLSGFGGRALGMALPKKNTAAILIPSVGCPMGCNFCSTSALFGGKGNFLNFYETGDSLFSVMCQLEDKLKVRSFFVLDENFLLHQKRALRLLELMEQHNKSWTLCVFSSAQALKLYTIEQLLGLGISWVWMGLEGENSQYVKLKEINSCSLVQELQSCGIRVLGSTIIGLENHTPENIGQIIDWAVSHSVVFHQFMLYMPIPGTPLYEQVYKEGNILSEEECPLADMHGQDRFNYRHKHIDKGRETEFLLSAFNQDFKINGPSIIRMIRVMFMGWKKYKDHPNPHIRNRLEWEFKRPAAYYAGAVWAMKKWYSNNGHIPEAITTLLRDLYKEFGWKVKAIAPLLGIAIYFLIKREANKLLNGVVYEPPTFYEKNAQALALEK